MKTLRLIPDGTNIDFIGKRFIAYAISLALVFASIGLMATKGLNFGIDFTGGTLIEIETPEVPDLPEMRAVLGKLGLGDVSLQEFGDPQNIMIRLPQQAGEEDVQQAAIRSVQARLAELFPGGAVEYRRVEYVGPQVGGELKKKGLYAMLLSMAGILAYIWIRFEWQFGVAAVVALLHDAIATLGLFALTRMPFDLSTLAAVLLVAGYSINDTVVVFDRIRENLRKYKKLPLPELFNQAVNQTLARSLMTSLTTLLALAALVIFGGEVIRGFTWALIFGIGVGTFSSVYVASPLLLYMNLRRGDGSASAAEQPAASEPSRG